MKYVMTWQEACDAGVDKSGGKGFNLGRLACYGFNVPTGGVLSADVYREDRESLSPEAIAAIDAFLAAAGLTDASLAVRSSAVCEDGARASFAGIHDSYLNVRGMDAVVRAILDCYQSLRTARARAYRERMGFTDEDVDCAVVLCEMVDAKYAGVAFSGDPQTGRRDLVVIEAAPGLGDQVVSGAVNPDAIQIRFAQGRFTLESRNAQRESVLTKEQEIELAHHVMRVHWALGEGQDPQDIEWAHDGDVFYVLQARPVTEFPFHTFDGAKKFPIYWSNANIKDAVPGVASFFTWSLIRQVIDDVLYAMHTAAGYPIPPGIQTVRRFDGHAYFDFSGMQWCVYDAFGVLPSETVKSIGGHQPEIPLGDEHPLRGPEGTRRTKARLRLMKRMWGLDNEFKTTIARHFDELGRIALSDLTPLSRAELTAIMRRIQGLLEVLHPLVGLANVYSNVWKDGLEKILEAVAGNEAPALMSGLLTGAGNITSAEQGYRVYDLAQAKRQSEAEFQDELKKFLDEFGHRAVYEADALNPRWSEDQSYILEQVDKHLGSGAHECPREHARRVRAGAEKKLRERTFWRRPIILWLAKHMRLGFAMRESAKSAHSATLAPTRRLLLEMARRLGEAGHLEDPNAIFHLAAIDVESYLVGYWDGRGAEALTSDRTAQRDAWRRMHPPDVIVEGDRVEPMTPVEPESTPTGGWKGIPVSAGRAERIARVVRHPHEGHVLGHGEILVTPSTDPGWTPLFLRAGALVMETGGYLSHGAIVAREFGIPAVVNIPGVLDRVHDGDKLLVDGNRGIVAVL